MGKSRDDVAALGYQPEEFLGVFWNRIASIFAGFALNSAAEV